MMKKKIKEVLGSTFSKFNYPLLVNSYGRSGSTVLTRSIVKGAIPIHNEIVDSLAHRSISQPAWELEKSDLQNGIIYKTHDYPPSRVYNEKVKMLYTFADPIDVVLSLLRFYDTKGESWMRKHYDHLKVPYTNYENLIKQDQLQLEKHLDSWLNEDRFPIAFIRYETMWEHLGNISNFLGFEIQLPPKREREAKQDRDPNLIHKLNKTYESLVNKVEKLDSFFVQNGR